MALYTPFFERATQTATQAMANRRAGELAQSAYMGDQQALAELFRVNPDMAQRVQTQKMQEEQMKLSTAATQQSMAASQQQMQQSAQQFALQNRDLIQSVMQQAAQLPTHAAAQQFVDSQIQQLKASGVNVPPSISAQQFTPETYAQIRQVYAEPVKPVEVSAGASLIDPATREVLFTAPQAIPGGIQTLQFKAQQAGLTPGTPEYQEFMRQQGQAPQTTINMPGETRGLAKLQEGAVESFLPLIEQGAASAMVQPQLQALKQLAGATTEGRVGQVMSEFFPTYSDANTAYSSLVNQILPSMRAPGSGAQSDRDIDVLQKGIGGLGASHEVKSLVIDSLIKKNDIAQAKADLTQKLIAGEISPQDALKERRRLDSQSILSPDLQKKLNVITGSAGSAQEGATATNPQTGERVILRNGQWEPL